jgi:hypothetical protein
VLGGSAPPCSPHMAFVSFTVLGPSADVHGSLRGRGRPAIGESDAAASVRGCLRPGGQLFARNALPPPRLRCSWRTVPSAASVGPVSCPGRSQRDRVSSNCARWIRSSMIGTSRYP